MSSYIDVKFTHPFRIYTAKIRDWQISRLLSRKIREILAIPRVLSEYNPSARGKTRVTAYYFDHCLELLSRSIPPSVYTLFLLAFLPFCFRQSLFETRVKPPNVRPHRYEIHQPIGKYRDCYREKSENYLRYLAFSPSVIPFCAVKRVTAYYFDHGVCEIAFTIYNFTLRP